MITHGHCTETIKGQQPRTGPATGWRQWIATGRQLFKKDVGDLFALMVVWQRRAAMRHHMRTLDDRMIKDIGVSRVDIVAEAAKPFWRG